MKNRKMIFIFLSLLLSITSSCSLSSRSKKSFILILVDDLGSEDVNCNREPRDNVHSGLSLLCQESIRFTHTFTTSLLSNPALASILTAQYPLSHGVHNNGKDWLKPESRSLAELAQKSGYKTAFFSGGAPVLRKSGFHQGYDLFDDTFELTPKLFFRPFVDSQHRFLQWFAENSSDPFFATFYLPDLAFLNRETKNDFGEVRNLSYESQLEEFDESLFDFFKELKQRKLWNETWIVVAGLSGSGQIKRSNENKYTSLLNDNSQVALLIKVPQKMDNEANNWSIDDNTTLADLGATLFELVGGEKSKSLLPELPVQSLATALQNSSAEISKERFILIESAWPEWRRSGTTRYSLKQSHLSYINDATPRVYNSLIDHMESTSISPNESSILNFSRQAQALAHRLSLKKYIKTPLLEKKPTENMPCQGLAEKTPLTTQDRRACDNGLFWELIDWVSKDQENTKKKFLKSYYYYNLDQEVQKTQKLLFEPWDVVLENNSLVESYLAKPGLSKYKMVIQRSVNQSPTSSSD